jgi:glycosyltransferase involved in cell wall biosynthesis
MILTDWYYPAYQAGGPVQSSVNMVNFLKSKYDIFIITSNKELDQSILNLSFEPNQWIDYAGYKIKYSKNPKNSLKEIFQIQPDILFFNTFFSVYFNALLLKILIRKNNFKIVISLRGMLKPSALKVKFLKKIIYIRLLKFIRIEKKVTFQATNQLEASEISTYFSKAKIEVINNIPFVNQSQNKENIKKQGSCKLVFASRLHPVKNLSLLLNCLKDVQSIIEVTVIGEWSNDSYKYECERLLKQLPKNISVNIQKSLPHKELISILYNFDVYVLPTKGENFGHSIFEALSVGLPVIISDQTPWKNLQKLQIGFDLPLNDSTLFSQKIDFFARMDQTEYQIWSDNAFLFAKKFIEEQQYTTKYDKLLQKDFGKIGIVGPIPFIRYKGGISIFIEQLLKRQTQFQKKGISLIHLNTCAIPRKNNSIGKMHWANFYNYLLFLVRSFKSIRREQIEKLHIHTSIGLSLIKDSFSALLFRLFLGKKIILHIHFAEEKQLFPNAFKWLTKRLLKASADEFIVLSKNIKSFMIALGIPAEHVHQINNFHFQNGMAVEMVENEIKIITYIGSLDERKGIVDLMTAMGNVKNKAWQLHIVGEFIDNKYKQRVFDIAAVFEITNKVVFHGYLDENKKNDILKVTDVLVLPSYAEGMPLTILEGLAFGIAIVATDVGANSEFLKGVCNLVPSGDTDKIAHEISELIENKSLLDSRKSQALALSAQFTFDDYFKKIIPIYQSNYKI